MATAEEMQYEQDQRLATAKQVFIDTLRVFFPGVADTQMLNDLYEAAKPRITLGQDPTALPDLMLQSGELDKIPTFTNRFAGIVALNKKKMAGEAVYVPSIREYLAGEEAYARLVTSMGMANLGTRENYAKLVGDAQVSLDEVTERITDAKTRIDSLDADVKNQLKAEFPGLTDGDMMGAILTPNGIQDLQKRITRAEIGTEAKQAGLVSQLGTTALQERGVTRAQARVGFQKIADTLSTTAEGYQQAGRIFGEGITTGQLQTELEKEQLLGQTSKRTKRLASQARAQFGGQSGIVTGSLSKNIGRSDV